LFRFPGLARLVTLHGLLHGALGGLHGFNSVGQVALRQLLSRLLGRLLGFVDGRLGRSTLTVGTEGVGDLLLLLPE
jgi:hypothetical protein